MTDLPIFQKLYDFYRSFYGVIDHFPRKARDVLGANIERTVLELLELVDRASYAAGHSKRQLVETATQRLDFLKVLIRLCCELKIIDQKKYFFLEAQLQTIGRMLGGWLKTIRPDV